MLKREEYLKTVRRPYPPFFYSLVNKGLTDAKNFKGLIGEPFRSLNNAHVDNIWYYTLAEIEKVGRIAFKNWRTNLGLNRVKKEFKKREGNLIKSAIVNLEDFCHAYQYYIPSLMLIFAIEELTQKALSQALLEKITVEKVNKLMGDLNVPLEDNYYKQEDYDLVTSSDLSKHVKKYQWLGARYGQEKGYTFKEAEEKLNGANKKEFLKKWNQDKNDLKKIIKHAKNILGKDANLVDLFQYIIYYRTQRTDIINKAAFLAIPILKSKAKALGLSYKQLLLCSEDEVFKNRIPARNILKARAKDCSVILDNGIVKCLTGKESQKLIKFFAENISSSRELKGNPACHGIVRGAVKIIMNRNNFEKIKNGDILVASMTTPEMVPIMKKAAAFVTDEGGVTCHAAIISREMNKPCVIGTKIATRVFKDGDKVEVDANKGIVRKL